jgi:hypothetical protein
MPAKSGSSHHKAKLDDKKVKAIRAACLKAHTTGNKRPIAELAERYGVSRGTITAVADGRTWAHVAQG